MRAALLALLVSVGVAAGAAACGGDPAPGGRQPVEDSAAASDSSAADSTDGDPRPLRSRLLRLVNSREGEVVVHAGAGRGWVVLDTVPAGDSTRVRVESRARKVGLRAAEAGRAVATDSVDLTGSGPARWRIPPADTSSSEDDPEASGKPREGPDRRAPDTQPPSSPLKKVQVSASRS